MPAAPYADHVASGEPLGGFRSVVVRDQDVNYLLRLLVGTAGNQVDLGAAAVEPKAGLPRPITRAQLAALRRTFRIAADPYIALIGGRGLGQDGHGNGLG